jgi:CDAN1-interacting nuclease 1
MHAALKKYPEYMREIIEAIYKRKFQYEIMKNIGKLQKSSPPELILSECLAMGSVKSVADRNGVSVCALARFFMRSIYPPERIAEYLRSPVSIPNEQLKGILMVEADAEVDQSHPDWDIHRRSHGLEMEERLKAMLEAANILFYQEGDLRTLGYPKTPDIKLPYPIGLSGEPVCWIESKALFGDGWIHSECYKIQYQPYANRFGPGAVIYWHGYIEGLKYQSDGLVLFDDESFQIALANSVKII